MFSNGERIWRVGEQSDWGFTYIIMRLPGSGQFRSNVTDIADDASADVVAHAVREHFRRCIRRCMTSRPTGEFIEELHPELASSLGEREATRVVEALRTEFEEDPSFSVRTIPFTMTRNGNMISLGGYDFPWPFTYVVARQDDGWRFGDAPRRPSRPEAQADAQRHFDARIERLTEGPLEHRVRTEMIEAAAGGPGAVLEVARRLYTGVGRHDPDLPLPV